MIVEAAQSVAMRHTDEGGAGQRGKKGLVKAAFIAFIQGRGRLVQKQDRRPEQERSRHRQPLLFSGGQHIPPVSNFIQPMAVSRQIHGLQSLLTGQRFITVRRCGITQGLTEGSGRHIAALGQEHGLTHVEGRRPASVTP